LVNSYQATARLVQDEDVIDVRNWAAHGNVPFPGNDRIARALNHIADLRINLRDAGLYPQLYELIRVSRDGLGREGLIYSGPGKDLTLFRPHWAVAPKMPLGDVRLLFVPVARTESSGPLRFRINPRPGGDPYWEGWPKRWPGRTSFAEVDHLPTESSDLADAG
jgi:hypothetical protein